jgi:ATP-binding cassette subfamily B protein
MGMQWISYFAGGLPGMLLSVGSAIVFLYGGSRVIDQSMSLGTFGAFLAYQMRVFAPAQALMGLYASLATARVSWRRVLEILDAPVDVVESLAALPLTVRGELAFESVCVSTERSGPSSTTSASVHAPGR